MKLKLFVLTGWVALIFSFAFVQAQSWFDDGLSPTFHKERREALRLLMPDNSVAVFFSSPVKKRSNDTYYDYRPDSDLYYMAGIREPNTALIVFKDPQEINGQIIREMIFVQPRNPRAEQWDGELLGIEGVKEKLGFTHAYLNTEFLKNPKVDLSTFEKVLTLYPGIIEGGKYNNALQTMVTKLKELSMESGGEKSLNAIMDKLRSVKTTEEITLLRKAIEISGKGHIEAIKSIQPGVSERAVQGVHEFVQKALGAESAGYSSIVGAGNNTTILHYIYNNKRDLQEGLILMDVGAEYRGYTGDITRTVPVKGKFSEEEKAIYEVVLKAVEASISACKPGTTFAAIAKISNDIINKGLIDLGIVNAGERHPYFPHGIGHYLGLDVHDRGNYGKLLPGMVITVEPGIYIPEGSKCDPKWWSIGIRIEDNILITENGYENLSDFVPKSIEDIEQLMTAPGVLQKLK